MSGKLEKLRVKIRSFSLRDMLDFKNLPLRRDKAIDAAEDREIDVSFPINSNATLLHPAVQEMVISEIIGHGRSDAKTFVLRKTDGTPAAWFRSGQYVSLKMKVGQSYVTRPYSISSSPKMAADGVVCITVKETPGGFVSDYMLSSLKEGESVTEQEMREYITSHLARHKVPRYIEFVDGFPLNAAGKVLKYKMREEAARKLGLAD